MAMTSAERMATEAANIWKLIDRIGGRASDGRYYLFEDEDREKAIEYLKRLASSYDKASSYAKSREEVLPLNKPMSEQIVLAAARAAVRDVIIP